MRKELGMMKKNSFFLLLVGLMFVISSGVFARSWFDEGRKPMDRSSRVQQFSPQDVAPEKIKIAPDEGGAISAPAEARRSLGVVSSTAGSPGVVVDNSYHDWQWTYAAHKVNWRGRPYVQFAYNDRQAGAAGETKFGYNVYNPIGATWPRGQGAGCEVQPNVAEQHFLGLYPTIAMNSRGRVVLGGYDQLYWNQLNYENAIYYQPTTPFSCTWGAGTRVPEATYAPGMIADTIGSATASHLFPIMIDLQEWNGDTITHVVGSESLFPYNPPGCANCAGMTPVLYFRKVTFGNTGTWLGPTVLDTAQYMCHLIASPNTPKVSVLYITNTATGIAHNNGDDLTLVYRESDSVGVSWKPKAYVTNYNQMTGPSYTPWVEAKGQYDSNGKLHVIFNGIPVPQDPYGTGFGWNSLLNGSSMLHWSNATNTISKIFNAEWDFTAFPWPTTYCGFIGTNMLTTGNFAISECNGHMYVVWVMGNNPAANPPLLNDCASGGTRDTRYQANGEIYLSVSSDLDGLLWDAPRNLTRTPTPGCDSAGFGGVCYSDVKPTMSDRGMDITSFDTNAIPVTLTWPDTGVNPGPGPYTGNYYTHLFYVEDQYPDQKAINPTVANAGLWTNNPLKWMRLACVAPVSAPQIAYTPTGFGYPDWTKHNKPDTTVVTVQNDGNATLNVGTIGIKKIDHTGQDWLGVTAASLVISAGVSNTGTFGIVVNKGGIINTPGTIVSLNGEVYMKSNVAAPRDSLTISITNFLVADTLVNLRWDTVATGCTRLVLSNNGDVGRLGDETVNMDYIALGGECVTTSTVYAYDGGPIVIRKNGSNYIYSSALFQGSFTTEQSFKPFNSGPAASHASGTGYDGSYTGTFVNRDTTIGVRRTYYAPTAGTDSCMFVIQKSVFYGVGGTKANVTVGEVVDWDIPSYSGSLNDGRVLTSKNIVYQQGLDTSTTRCQKHYNRFGAIVFLGQWTNAEKSGDPTFYDPNFHGAYVMLNDTLFKYDTLTNTQEGSYFWNQMGALSGLTAAPFQGKDMHSVLTYKHNVTLDTLTAFTALLSVKNGDTTTLKAGVDKARKWFLNHLCPGCPQGNCCTANSLDGRAGNVDGDAGKGVDIADLSALIDFLYISFTPPPCLLSANIDGDGAGGIDIADLSGLIDYLYISFTPPALCPN